MSNQLILKNSNVEGDSLSLEVILNKLTEQGNTNVCVAGIFYEDLVGGINNIYSYYWQLLESRPSFTYTDNNSHIKDTRTNEEFFPSYPVYKLKAQKGRDVLIESDDSEQDFVVLGYIISEYLKDSLSINSPGPEGNFVDLSLITHQNRAIYTIPNSDYFENIFIYPIVTPKTNSINFNHFIKEEEEALQTKFSAVPRGEKLNHIFETISHNNRDFISKEVPYSARYTGLIVIDRNKKVYLYTSEEDLSKIEEIKSDIRFTNTDYLEDKSKSGAYKIIEPLYEDEIITDHLHFNITKLGHPILVFINKSKIINNYPFHSANIQSTESMMFELSSSEGEVDIANMDISFYVGDSFSRAYKIPFDKFGKNTLSLELLRHDSFGTISDDLNIYCVIKDNGKMKIYKIVNHNILSVSIID